MSSLEIKKDYPQILHAYILAGGKSSRMQEEKGLVIFQGKPLIQYAIEAALLATDSIFIITSNVGYAEFNLPLIADIEPNLGPAGAIDTALQHSSASHNLILACDMPFIDMNSLQYLIKESLHTQITVPLYRQFPEALFAIYHTDCKSKWHDLVRNDVRKLSELISHFETNFVDGNKMSEVNPHLFTNLNSKQDLNI